MFCEFENYNDFEHVDLYENNSIKSTPIKQKVVQSNCKNCGAPLSKNDCCDYCGSDFRVIETPKLNNLKNGGKIEPKKDSWNNLSYPQKTAIILMSTFAPLAILKFYKK